MNTWAYVGDLSDRPQLSCVYKSEDAQNEFLSNPKLGIGEDVYDDDIKREMAAGANTKRVKNKQSEGQREVGKKNKAKDKAKDEANERVREEEASRQQTSQTVDM